MKAFAITTALALAAISALPAFAITGEDLNADYVHGRSKASLEATLRDRGLPTAGLEEWGTVIRAWVPDGNGGTEMQFIDPDTLELLSSPSA